MIDNTTVCVIFKAGGCFTHKEQTNLDKTTFFGPAVKSMSCSYAPRVGSL